jgi:hypothetical protein
VERSLDPHPTLGRSLVRVGNSTETIEIKNDDAADLSVWADLLPIFGGSAASERRNQLSGSPEQHQQVSRERPVIWCARCGKKQNWPSTLSLHELPWYCDNCRS